MGQRRAELTPEASPWHQWGAELRRCRDARGISLEQLGRQVYATRSYLSKLERGLLTAPRPIAVSCDDALDLAGALVRAWEQAKTSADGAACVHVSSSDGHVSDQASTLVQPEPEDASSGEGISVPCRLRDGRMIYVTVPRRAFIRSGINLGALAAMGMAGQLDDGTFQAAKLARVRNASYGYTPIEHLQKLRNLLIDNDNLMGPRQVIPVVHQQISVIQELRREIGGSDRRKLLELQTQFAEFASWLHQDAGDYPTAQFWLDRALQWSQTVGDRDLTCYVMTRKSQLAGETRDLVDVVDLAEAAQNIAKPGSRLAAVGQTFEAFGHALRGEGAASERIFDNARAAVDELTLDESPWGVWLDSSYVEVHRAQSLEVLGDHVQAAEAFAEAIRQLPDGYHRDRGVYLAREAVAYAGAAVPEQAAGIGLHALAIAEDTGSARILNELARLDTALHPWKDLPEVAEFRTTLDTAIVHETGKPS